MNRFSVVTVVLLCTFFMGCKQEKEVMPKEPVTVEEIVWEKDLDYGYGTAIILKTEVFGNKMMSITPDILSVQIADRTGKRERQGYKHWGDYDFPDILSENTGAGLVWDTGILFYSISESTSNTTSEIDITKLGLDITGLTDSPRWGCFSASVNGRVKFMVPCYTSGQKNALLLLELQEWTSSGSSARIQILSSRIIPLPGVRQFVHDIRFINGSFFLSRTNVIDGNSSNDLRISPEGEITTMPNVGFATSYFNAGKDSVGYVDAGSEVFISGDNGNSWKEFSGLDFRNSWRVNKVKDRLIAFNGPDIRDLDIGKSRWKDLDSKGLPRNNITAVNYLSDTVYVSTLGGVMYKKAYRDFLKNINATP